MENKESLNDASIRKAIQSVHAPVPPQLDQQVSRALKQSGNARIPRFVKRRWRMGIAMAGSLVLAALLLFIPGGNHREHRSRVLRPSIKTQFEIPGKKIKIVWMQRDGFSLPSTEGARQ